MKTHALNNFDFFRFVMALLVVISHSFPLSGLSESEQLIYKITSGQMVYSSLGLNGFFVISGYFIFQSMQRSNNLSDYFWKRILRIFPGLLIVLLFSTVLAFFVYDSSTPFYKNIDFYTYIPYNLSLYGFQGVINGVFDTNAYHAINGSLWTIRYEFSLYIAVALLFFFKEEQENSICFIIHHFYVFLFQLYFLFRSFF